MNGIVKIIVILAALKCFFVALILAWSSPNIAGFPDGFLFFSLIHEQNSGPEFHMKRLSGKCL